MRPDLPFTLDPLPRYGADMPGANNGKRLATHPESKKKWFTRNVESKYPNGVITRVQENDRLAVDTYSTLGINLVPMIRPPTTMERIADWQVQLYRSANVWPHDVRRTVQVTAYANEVKRVFPPIPSGTDVRPMWYIPETLTPISIHRFLTTPNLPLTYQRRYRSLDAIGLGTEAHSLGTCISSPYIQTQTVAIIPAVQNNLDGTLLSLYDPEAKTAAIEEPPPTPLDEAANLISQRRYSDAGEVLKRHLASEADDIDAQRVLGYALLLSYKTKDGIDALSSAYSSDPLLASDPLDLAAAGISESQLRELCQQVVGLANKTRSAGSYVAAAALMQARERSDLAIRMVENAKGAGLDAEVAAQLVQGFSSAQGSR